MGLFIIFFGKGDTCGKNGFSGEKTSNGIVYCNYHVAQYVREQGYTACACSGCYRKREKATTSKKSTKSSDWKSYDEGYEDVYEDVYDNDDYE